MDVTARHQLALVNDLALALWGEFGVGDDNDHITRAELRSWLAGWLDAQRTPAPERVYLRQGDTGTTISGNTVTP